MIIKQIPSRWKAKINNKDYRTREEFAKFLGENEKIKERAELLVYLLNDKSNFVRSQALESLMLVGKKKYLKYILPLLDDKDEVVRADAIECIGILGGKKAATYLINSLDDRCDMVRMYAGTVIGECKDKSFIKYLEKRLEKERSNLAKVGLLDGLYLLGQEEKLENLLQLFKSRRYHVRCSVANILQALVNKKNKKRIKESLLRALSKEDTVAAKSSIENALNSM